MINKNFFKRAKNELEGAIRPQKDFAAKEKEKAKMSGIGEAAEELWTSCASCKSLILKEDLRENLYVAQNVAIIIDLPRVSGLNFSRIAILLQNGTVIWRQRTF